MTENTRDNIPDNTPEPKRTYQDSLFRFLFSDKASAIELYNALEGTDYDMDTEVEFTTLKDVIYAGAKNDLSFKIAEKYVVMTEHQSTINHNMPLRHLEYIAQTYKNMLENRDLFKYSRIMIPTPEFYVIYTGTDNWNVQELRLSESFIGGTKENSLELVVKIIDVRYNKEKAKEVLARSEKLRGYSILLSYVHDYRKKLNSLKEAVDLAVTRCIREGILKDFLTKYGREVRGMLYDDISIEEFAQIRAEEKGEERFREGLERGHQAGLTEGLERGHQAGLTEGLERGHQAGLTEGLAKYSALIQKLTADNRYDDIEKASSDEDYLKKLFEEYSL